MIFPGRAILTRRDIADSWLGGHLIKTKTAGLAGYGAQRNCGTSYWRRQGKNLFWKQMNFRTVHRSRVFDVFFGWVNLTYGDEHAGGINQRSESVDS